VGHLTHSEKNGGSLFAADPERAFDRQSIFWAPEALSTVVSIRQVGAASDAGQYAIDWTRLAAGGDFRQGPDGWHAIVPLAGAIHRLHLAEIPARGSLVRAELPFDANFDTRLLAADRFWSAMKGRRLGGAPLALPRHRRGRLIRRMRALDGWLAGNNYREIAIGLFGKERVVGRPWKDNDLRSLIIRLVKSAVALMRGGYRALLCPSSRKK
jgi:hypothetical protein